MDPITHAALGAAAAEAILFKRDKQGRSSVWLVGALAAMAPDLDIFINSNTDPMLALLFHRNFTHSLTFIPLGAALVTLGLMLFKRFRKNPWLTFLAALIGYATHGLLDACTSYGTMLFWPFSETRVSWDIIAIIDPRFTTPLVLGTAWTVINKKRLGVFVGLSLAGLFMLFNIYQHSRAMSVANTYAQEQHLATNEFRVFPYLASSTLWRSAIISNNQIYVADILTPLFKKNQLSSVGVFPLFRQQQLPAEVMQSHSQLHDFTIFNWFCDGYVILAHQNPLILVDGRYLINKNPTIALWGIQFVPGQPHVSSFSLIKLGISK
ncbi:hypothetical protein BN59_02013 [Legionella massiliensis]|uniref:Inner membrane protein n=1 Tax=Legionella massiliensis TaxID=1034943 RepID=A0A078L0Z1_9GAMM|nr:metal-dependent hydrolase [Legionella massiliensis]CDZ77723.1 hypothetical protein BN59_02013 [Legionella massiliensis]CEE13461.1 hypothetical protein BN1094_02013 [Legionella massiliensis]